MTALAFRDGLMLILVTGGAGKGFMLGRIRVEHLQDIVMTCGTVLGWGLGRIGHLKRHVGLMTVETIRLHHLLAVGGVALHAVWNHAMGLTVTAAAVQAGVLALILLQLGHLIGVTGEAWFRDITFNGNDQRGVGVCMTAQTTLQLKMRGSLMTFITRRNNVVAALRGMAFMTFNTGHLGAVGFTILKNILGLPVMTFVAVIGCQLTGDERCNEEGGG